LEIGAKPPDLPSKKAPNQREWRRVNHGTYKGNPILEACKYADFLKEDAGATYDDAAVAFGVTKARVCQQIALLKKLPNQIIDAIASVPGANQYITERKLRPLTLLATDEEKISRFEEMLAECES